MARAAHLSPPQRCVPGGSPEARRALEAGVTTDTLDTLSTGWSRLPRFTLSREGVRERGWGGMERGRETAILFICSLFLCTFSLLIT